MDMDLDKNKYMMEFMKAAGNRQSMEMEDVKTFLRHMGWSEKDHPDEEITGWFSRCRRFISIKDVIEVLKRRPADERGIANMRYYFQAYDQNGDGVITKEEVITHFGGLDGPFPKLAFDEYERLSKDIEGEVTIDAAVEKHFQSRT